MFSTNGICYFDKKKIVLNSYLIEFAPENIIWEIVTHEVAHALAEKKGDYKHGNTWRTIHKKLGGTGSVLFSTGFYAPPKYTATCCGYIHKRIRITKKTTPCHICKKPLTWNNVK